MSVITIDSLTEVQSAGENDYLLLSTSNGAKKIKASAVGGSGNFDVTVTLGETVTADKTLQEIAQAYRAGNNVRCIAQTGDNEYFIFSMTSFKFQEDAQWSSDDNYATFYGFGDGGITIEFFCSRETTGTYANQDHWTYSVYMIPESQG